MHELAEAAMQEAANQSGLSVPLLYHIAGECYTAHEYTARVKETMSKPLPEDIHNVLYHAYIMYQDAMG